MTKLSAKREQFALEYVTDLNAKQAAIRAGYAPRSADVTASRLLTDAKVADRVRELLAERQQRTEITADQTLRDLRHVADIAMGRVPTVKTIQRKDPETGETCVEQVEVQAVNFQGALRALELLGKHQGLFREQADAHKPFMEAFWKRMEEARATSTPQGRIKARLGVLDNGDN